MTVEFKLELVLIPVSDVDGARDFCTQAAGFTLVVDGPVGDRMRIVQVTPPGSGCSVGFGTGLGLGAGRDFIMAPPDRSRGCTLLWRTSPPPGTNWHPAAWTSERSATWDGQWKPGLDPQLHVVR
jgi:hypothetical protein